MKKTFVNILVSLSALACVASVHMWVVSYKYFDMLHTTTPGRIFDIESCKGEVQMVLSCDDSGTFNPGRRTQLWTRETRDGNYISRYRGFYESAYDFILFGVGVGWNQVAANSPNQHHYRLLLPYWLIVAVFGITPAVWVRKRVMVSRVGRNVKQPTSAWRATADPF